MAFANTQVRNKWTPEEDKKLLIGFNRHYETIFVSKSIEKDDSLNFNGRRSNIDIKDRLRTIKRHLKPFKSFFIPIDCQDPREFIPEELWYAIEEEEEEIIATVPESDRIQLNDILYQYTTVTTIHKFLRIYERLPESLDENPIATTKTWSQICDKCFKACLRMQQSQLKMELLRKLVSNGHLKKKTIGNRIFVYKA